MTVPIYQKGCKFEKTNKFVKNEDLWNHRFNSEPIPLMDIDTKVTGGTIPFYSSPNGEDLHPVFLIVCDFNA